MSAQSLLNRDEKMEWRISRSGSDMTGMMSGSPETGYCEGAL
jgi:hypothetical protein